MRNKNKRRGGLIASALVLLALSASPAAYGQVFGKSDRGSNEELNEGQNDENQFGWGRGMTTNETPVGGGLLVLTAAGLCYAGAKKVKRVKSKK